MSDYISVDCPSLDENADGLITAGNALSVKSLSPVDTRSVFIASVRLKNNYQDAQDRISDIKTAMADKGKIIKDYNGELKQINENAGNVTG